MKVVWSVAVTWEMESFDLVGPAGPIAAGPAPRLGPLP